MVIATLFLKNKEEYEAISLNTFYQNRKNTHFLLSENKSPQEKPIKSNNKKNTQSPRKPEKTLMHKIITDVNSEDDDAYDILMKKFNEQRIQRQQSVKS